MEGWTCDANKYSTDFRVSVKKSHGKTEADLRVVIDALPSNLACSFNLGSADFYPATSGKDKAAKYLMKALGHFDKDATVSMGDDDNDLALAKVVGHTYIPGFTAESVRTAVQEEPQAFTVAKHGAFLGTHEVLEHYRSIHCIWFVAVATSLGLLVGSFGCCSACTPPTPKVLMQRLQQASPIFDSRHLQMFPESRES